MSGKQNEQKRPQRNRVLLTLDEGIRDIIDELPVSIGRVPATKINFIIKDWLLHQGYLSKP